MKTIVPLSVILVLAIVQGASGQSGRVQFIHSAPDPALDVVDVYLDDALFRDDFAFGSATPYFDIGAGQHSISFAAQPSSTSDETFYTLDVEIEEGKAYSLIAAGFGDPAAFAPNPDGSDTGFKLMVIEGARETNDLSNRFHLRQIYTIPDMPTSDFLIGSWVGTGYKYGDMEEADDVEPGSWESYLRSSGKSTSAYAALSFNSSSLVGLGVVAVVTGRFYTGDGIDIEAFFVRPDGTTLPFQITTQTFRAQMIHASADPEVASVDVYLDGGLLFRDLSYPGARPFINMPIGTHQMDVVPSGTGAGSVVLLTHREQSANGDSKHILLTGFAEPEDWGPNPDGLETDLKLMVVEGARETNGLADRFYLRQIYTIPDMPTSDFLIGSWVGTGYTYGDMEEAENVEPGTWESFLRSSGTSTSAYAALSFNSSSLVGLGVVAVVTGRFYTGNGIDVEAFFVRPDGTTLPFETTTQTFRTQMIHASADPAVASVDAYLDGGLLFRDVSYPGARAFIDVPIGTHQIDVVPSGTGVGSEVLLSHREQSANGDSKHILLTGFAEPEDWGPNPDGLETDLKLMVVNDAVETNDLSDRFHLRQIYTIPDMPTSDFLIGSWVGTGYRYGDMEEAEDVEPGTYDSYLRTNGTSTSPYAQLSFNSSNLVGFGTVAVIAGRFYTGSGIDIEAFFVLPDGSISPFQTTTPTFRAQMIHASADPAIDSVHVHLDGGLLFKDLSYTSATQFIDLPAGTHELWVGPDPLPEGFDPRGLPIQREASVTGDSKYFVLGGVATPSYFPPNPDGHDTRLTLFVAEDALETSTDPATWSTRQFYGVLDAPAIDFWVDTWGEKIFEDVGYGQFTEVGTSDSQENLVGSVRVSGAGRHDPALISVEKNWVGYVGSSVLEVITGDTENIDWFYVMPNGVVESHVVVTGTEDTDTEIPTAFAVTGNYPNPFNPSTLITFNLPDAATVYVEVFDMTGRLVKRTPETTFSAGSDHTVQLNARSWSSGLYFYRVAARNRSSSWTGSGSMTLLK